MAYSPELNPVEKIGAFIKDAGCNHVYDTLSEIKVAIAQELQPLWHSANASLNSLATAGCPVN